MGEQLRTTSWAESKFPACPCSARQGWLALAYLAASIALLCEVRVGAADPPEVVIRPAGADKAAPASLTPEEQQRVDQAVGCGIQFLRRAQLPTGSWLFGRPNEFGGGINASWVVGQAALPGLALLESGVPAADPAVQRAAAFVRGNIVGQTRTYELALAILFLDRLGDRNDEALLRSVALRLAAGQTPFGGWWYNCPLLRPAQEKQLLEVLRGKTREDLPKQLRPPRRTGGDPGDDNSNTQFAVLALWVARKHDLPLDFTLARAEQRFRLSQTAVGWEYNWTGRPNPRGTGAMTCVGLLGLAVGRGSAPEEPAPEPQAERPKPEDGGIAWGLRALANYMNDPSDSRVPDPGVAPKGVPSLYFLWSVERVGVLCNVKTIGGKDWYRWGAELLIPRQRADGSWVGGGSGGFPAVDTSFALLFLKRSDLLPDLRETLQKRLTITDPGPNPNTLNPQPSPGEKANPPSSPEKKDSTEKPAPKTDSPAEEAPLAVDLGEVKAGQTTTKPLRVRGPAAFRFSGVRGTDAQLQLADDGVSCEVHELTLTLRPEQAGDFTRTLYFRTDLPGRAEVAVRIQARVRPAP